MSTVGQIEKKTQRRIVKLFRDTLGYDYLGDWTDRAIVAQTSAFEVCGSSRDSRSESEGGRPAGLEICAFCQGRAADPNSGGPRYPLGRAVAENLI
jgi:hypothetical protein